MNIKVVAMPPRNEILLRSLGYGACWGAVAGGLAGAVLALVMAATGGIAVGVVALMVSVPAALAGALAGLSCGLLAGVALIALRRHLGASRAAVRAVAGAGAAMLPTIFSIGAFHSQPRGPLPVAAGLTVVVFGLAAACGPRALYGRWL